MTPEGRVLLVADVKPAEAFRGKPYVDCCGKGWRDCRCVKKGKLTIGWGRNLDDVGVSKEEAEVLLHHDLYAAEELAGRGIPVWPALSEPRQRAVVELVFNMGLETLRTFKNFWANCAAGRWAAAAADLLDSKWAAQVGPARANRIADTFRKG